MINDLVHCIVSKESVEQTENKDTDIQVRLFTLLYSYTSIGWAAEGTAASDCHSYNIFQTVLCQVREACVFSSIIWYTFYR